MRGFFGVGLEQSSKPMNAGNLFRTAHAFGASFLFTVNAEYSVRKAKSDTSTAPRSIPWYDFECAEELKLPDGCSLVGVELLEDGVELPVFSASFKCCLYTWTRTGEPEPRNIGTLQTCCKNTHAFQS